MTPPEVSQTPLDAAHAAMTADPADDTARLRYYERLADGMLFVMLEAEAAGGTMQARVFETEDGPVVLAFDREERMAEAAGQVAAYAELPGRIVARTLAGQGMALGINLGVAGAGAFLVPAEALEWLATLLERAPEVGEARPDQFAPPAGVPDALLAGLDAKLARAGGLATAALLAGVRYADGRHGHMLAFLDAREGAEAALARAAAEALTFSGIEAGELDVAFLAASEPAAQAMARVALRFDLAAPEEAPASPRPAPGSDPARPPNLR